MSAVTEAQAKMDAKLAALTDSQLLGAIAHLPRPQNTRELHIVRMNLIKQAEARWPQVKAWIDEFYGMDLESPNWNVDYPDAILLAADELKIS